MTRRNARKRTEIYAAAHRATWHGSAARASAMMSRRKRRLQTCRRWRGTGFAVPPLPLAGEGRSEGKPCHAVEPLSPRKQGEGEGSQQAVEPLSLRERGRGEGSGYEDVPGFCHSASLEEVEKNGYVLTPGRYVGAPEEDDDDEAFEDKMQRLTAQLGEQMAKGAELDAVIKAKLGELGYGV